MTVALVYAAAEKPFLLHFTFEIVEIGIIDVHKYKHKLIEIYTLNICGDGDCILAYQFY